MNTWRFALTFLSAVGCGMVAGLLFAFSAFVMKALGRLPPAHGIAAMQSINVAIINPAFLLLFLGTGASCAVLAIASLPRWRETAAFSTLAGSLLYLIGVVVVTFVFNVPKNDVLASVQPASAAAASLWADYRSGWTAWNHVRAGAALGAAISFTLALCLRSRP